MPFSEHSALEAGTAAAPAVPDRSNGGCASVAGPEGRGPWPLRVLHPIAEMIGQAVLRDPGKPDIGVIGQDLSLRDGHVCRRHQQQAQADRARYFGFTRRPATCRRLIDTKELLDTSGAQSRDGNRSFVF